MAIQAGKPPLNFLPIDKTEDETGFKLYIEAIHHGFNGNYVPIKQIFQEILAVS